MAEYIYWKDIDINLTRKLNGDVNEYTNIDAINSSLKNIVETMMGTRRMLPSFAIGIHKMLFEPINPDIGRTIGNLLLEAILKWETRIVTDNIDIKVNEDKNQYEITIIYHITSTGSDDSQTFAYILQAV